MPYQPPVIKYLVLPVKAHQGQNVLVNIFDTKELAERELIRQAASTNEQFYLLQTIAYVNPVDDWPIATVESLMFPLV